MTLADLILRHEEAIRHAERLIALVNGGHWKPVFTSPIDRKVTWLQFTKEPQ